MTAPPPAPAGPLAPPCAINVAHDLSRFHCGKHPLDDWLRHHALASEGRSARTYVVCVGQSVVGYYCLATGNERRANVPRKIRHGVPDPTPLMIIGRLAVDTGCQGQRLGESLLRDALKRILAASAIVGARAALVHAIDDGAKAFYLKYGFIQFPHGSQTLFLPLETIQAAL